MEKQKYFYKENSKGKRVSLENVSLDASQFSNMPQDRPYQPQN